MSKERLVELLQKRSCWHNKCESRCAECDCFRLRDSDIDKVADYLLANGVIVPPCKVGDKVYFISRNSGKPIGRVDEIEITHIIKTKDGYSARGKTNGSDEFYIPDFEIDNYSFFRTREEAEAKLKEGESK